MTIYILHIYGLICMFIWRTFFVVDKSRCYLYHLHRLIFLGHTQRLTGTECLKALSLPVIWLSTKDADDRQKWKKNVGKQTPGSEET